MPGCPANSETINFYCKIKNDRLGNENVLYIDVDTISKTIHMMESARERTVNDANITVSTIKWHLYNDYDKLIHEYNIERATGSYTKTDGPTANNLEVRAKGSCEKRDIRTQQADGLF
jgi:hypothetical protein